VTYQGCAEAGLCYPPITRAISLDLTGASGGAASLGSSAGPAGAAAVTQYVSEQDRLALLLRTGNLLQVLLEFFLGGLLLAFTPCVLPMVPILSGLIVGHGERVTTTRAFLLSLTYVLGMAVTYTATGVACAAAGKQVQAIFQQPWIIVLFAALFVAMAFAMFGLFTVQMPSFVQSRLAQLSNRQRSGNFLGVGVMGMLSALIVTTCVGPVLVAALIVIGQTGDMFRGGSALFAMSLGMGAPLLVVGSSAGRWLPRAGAWMEGVKRLFGVLMLGMAAWMLARIVPARGSLLLFAVPTLAAAVVCWGLADVRARAGVWLARGGAVLAALYGIALLFGAARGAEDPLQPLAPAAASAPALNFRPVASVAELREQVQSAAAAHQAVLLDIDADWCTSCKEMQRYTFTDPEVRRQLKSVRLLRANVTANNTEDQALLHEAQSFGPPTLELYDANGREQKAYRVIGFMKAAQFAALLRQALATG
jgi:thiol:disulfide interchange protein DsbD